MGSLYEHDPEMAPDSEFQSGRLDLLVVGNEGRLLDCVPVFASCVAAEARGSIGELTGLDEGVASGVQAARVADHCSSRS